MRWQGWAVTRPITLWDIGEVGYRWQWMIWGGTTEQYGADKYSTLGSLHISLHPYKHIPSPSSRCIESSLTISLGPSRTWWPWCQLSPKRRAVYYAKHIELKSTPHLPSFVIAQPRASTPGCLCHHTTHHRPPHHHSPRWQPPTMLSIAEAAQLCMLQYGRHPTYMQSSAWKMRCRGTLEWCAFVCSAQRNKL